MLKFLLLTSVFDLGFSSQPVGVSVDVFRVAILGSASLRTLGGDISLLGEISGVVSECFILLLVFFSVPKICGKY